MTERMGKRSPSHHQSAFKCFPHHQHGMYFHLLMKHKSSWNNNHAAQSHRRNGLLEAFDSNLIEWHQAWHQDWLTRTCCKNLKGLQAPPTSTFSWINLLAWNSSLFDPRHPTCHLIVKKKNSTPLLDERPLNSSCQPCHMLTRKWFF